VGGFGLCARAQSAQAVFFLGEVDASANVSPGRYTQLFVRDGVMDAGNPVSVVSVPWLPHALR
jgi:hypothetical protein